MRVDHDAATIRDLIAGRRVIASVSGGKDSAAASLYLRELGIEHERVFMDTGWEHELTYRYLRETLEPKLGPIRWLRGSRTMEELVKKKGMFPLRVRRFCTQELKVFPFRDYVATLDEEIVNVVGIRRAESAARARMPEWEEADWFDGEVWRPLLDWSLDDVVAIHRRHDLAPNPLYLLGTTRVGCWPCIFARKDEIRLIAETDPARIDRIRALEAEVQAAAVARQARKGTTLEEQGHVLPTWFVAPDVAAASAGHRQWSIDRVVAWSRTARGGRQFDLFAPPLAEEGCMRWGLCETVAERQT